MINLKDGNFFTMNAFETLFWMEAVYLLARIINRGSPTLWLWFGVLLGLGIENKLSTVFFGVGIFAALFLTPGRRQLTQKWVWLGCLISFGSVLPYLFWQTSHQVPT